MGGPPIHDAMAATEVALAMALAMRSAARGGSLPASGVGVPACLRHRSRLASSTSIAGGQRGLRDAEPGGFKFWHCGVGDPALGERSLALHADIPLVSRFSHGLAARHASVPVIYVISPPPPRRPQGAPMSPGQGARYQHRHIFSCRATLGVFDRPPVAWLIISQWPPARVPRSRLPGKGEQTRSSTLYCRACAIASRSRNSS